MNSFIITGLLLGTGMSILKKVRNNQELEVDKIISDLVDNNCIPLAKKVYTASSYTLLLCAVPAVLSKNRQLSYEYFEMPLTFISYHLIISGSIIAAYYATNLTINVWKMMASKRYYSSMFR